MAVGTVVATIVGVLSNLYIMIPFYGAAYGMPVEAIVGMGTAIIPAVDSTLKFVLLITAPFNLLKWVLISAHGADVQAAFAHSARTEARQDGGESELILKSHSAEETRRIGSSWPGSSGPTTLCCFWAIWARARASSRAASRAGWASRAM